MFPDFPSHSSIRPERILFAGASVRWACQAAGPDRTCIAADLFNDRDTVEACEKAFKLRNFDKLCAIAKSEAPDAIVALGGLENHPSIIRNLENAGYNIGCPPDSIERAQDFRFLQSAFEEHFPTTKSQIDSADFASCDQWLKKRLDRTSGRHVELVSQNDLSSNGLSTLSEDGFVFQEKLHGDTFGATFCCSKDRVFLVGLTQQLIGTQTSIPPFQYCGSIGPIQIPQMAKIRLESIAQRLATVTPLRGLFGLDFVSNDSALQDAKVVDVNLRLPASAEILQRAAKQINLIDLHLHATQGTLGDPASLLPIESKRMLGKLVVFNGDRELPIDETALQNVFRTFPNDVADIPPVGSVIGPVAPIMTVFAESAIGQIKCMRKALIQRAERIRELL